MGDLEIRPARDSGSLDAVRQLCRDAVAWEIDSFPHLREAIVAHFQPETLNERLALLPKPYIRPQGDILLASLRTEPVGTVMYTNDNDGEGCAIMNRLFVSPKSRGGGVGARLVEEVIARAHNDEYDTLRFVTARHLTSAIRIYESLGFRTVDPWKDFDPATAKLIMFMERSL